MKGRKLMDRFDDLWSVWGKGVQAHVGVYRLTGGLIGYYVPGAARTLLLDHVGAKTGTKRTTALSFIRDGEDLVLVASKGGHPKNPSWYHNLKANPDTMVQIRTEKRPVHAREATAAERERLWPKVVDAYSGYAGYQERTDREIPLVILEKRS